MAQRYAKSARRVCPVPIAAADSALASTAATATQSLLQLQKFPALLRQFVTPHEHLSCARIIRFIGRDRIVELKYIARSQRSGATSLPT